jgi:hypothetical protein
VSVPEVWYQVSEAPPGTTTIAYCMPDVMGMGVENQKSVHRKQHGR